MNHVAAASTIFTRLATENIPGLWHQIEPLLRKGMLGTPTATTEDVFRMAMAHRADIWAQVEPDNMIVEAVVVTDYEAGPQGVWLRLWICAVCDGYKLDKDRFRAQIEEWRIMQRCRGLVLVGRPGWSRIFPEAVVEGVVLRITDSV